MINVFFVSALPTPSHQITLQDVRTLLRTKTTLRSLQVCCRLGQGRNKHTICFLRMEIRLLTTSKKGYSNKRTNERTNKQTICVCVVSIPIAQTRLELGFHNECLMTIHRDYGSRKEARQAQRNLLCPSFPLNASGKEANDGCSLGIMRFIRKRKLIADPFLCRAKSRFFSWCMRERPF